MTNCIFCKIINHEAPAHIDPISDGHTLIIPKKDIHDLHSLDEETGSRVVQVARQLAGRIEKEFGFDGSTIMESNGAFQDVPHFHLHVFGRNKNNDLKIIPPTGVQKGEEHLREITKKISCTQFGYG